MLFFPCGRKSVKVKIPFSEKVASEIHNSIVLIHEGVAVPPMVMRDKVRQSAVLAEDFIIEGRQAFLAIQDILSRNGVLLGGDTKLLEFGVGCGRIARHFINSDLGQFLGLDVDDQLTSWCRDVLSKKDVRFSFFKSEYLPPLNLMESSIDIVYSISVFTHMQKETQEAWFGEISRIIKPGGYFLVSIIEETEDILPAGIRVQERVDDEYTRDWFGVSGAPETYFSTANTERYVTDKIVRDFELVAKQPKAVRGRQSLLLYKKR